MELLENGYTYLVTLVLTGWGLFLREYFKKSGEYQAMKENIATITRIQEDIKTEILELSTVRTQLQSEERSTIFALQQAYSVWFAEIESFEIALTEKLSENYDKLEAAYRNYVIAHGRFILIFHPNTKLKDAVDNLTNSTYNYHNKVIELANRFRQLRVEDNETQNGVYLRALLVEKPAIANNCLETWSTAAIMLRKHLGYTD